MLFQINSIFKIYFSVLQIHKYCQAKSDAKRIEYFKDHRDLEGIEAVDFGSKREHLARASFLRTERYELLQVGLVVKV